MVETGFMETRLNYSIKFLKAVISALQKQYKQFSKATITRCDLSQRSFRIDDASLKAIRYESKSLNRIIADKSHRVIVA